MRQFEHLRDLSVDMGQYAGGTPSRYERHAFGLEGADFRLCWSQGAFSTQWAAKRAAWTVELIWGFRNSGHRYRTIREVPEEYRESLRCLETYEALVGGQQMFWGFGRGLDAEFHRRLCEVTGLEGAYEGIGSILKLESWRISIPHPFFYEKGFRAEFYDREAGQHLLYRFTEVDALVAYQERLEAYQATMRKVRGVWELVERTFF